MAETARRKELDLPIKVLFNEEGQNFFLKNNKKLTRFKLAEEMELYGILFDTFSPASIQKLLMVNYIAYIEISRPEFSSKRQEVMDLSKVLTYGTFYRRFDEIVYQKILDSDVVKNWNRRNPSNIIDRKTTIKDSVLIQALEKTKSAVNTIKQELMRPIVEQVKSNDSMLPEEKNVQLFLAEKYLNNLRPYNWYLLVKFKDSDEVLSLLNQIEATLLEFMDKAKIAEYLSFMIMELAISAENTNIKNFTKSRYKNTLDPNTAIFDPEVRKNLITEMSARNQNVFITYKVGSDSKSTGSRARLQVKIFNKDTGFEEFKKNVEEGKGANTRQKSLLDFFKEDSGDSGVNTDLGLYYLSYLSDECTRVGVHFETIVNQVQATGLTVITMSFLI
jgi:hypothetical protein